jgi:hypothetical protein
MDASDGGLSILVRVYLAEGMAVSVRGGPGADGFRKAQIRWCTAMVEGGFRAGLRYDVPAEGPAPREREEAKRAQETPKRETPPPQPARPESEEPPADYYELLQVNPIAEPETIHRVYRILAQRYHPDNQETGNERQFRTLLEAYKVLSDPVERASYDLRRGSVRRTRLRLFDHAGADAGVDGERRKRLGVLAALYRQRVREPDAASLSVFEIEDLVGVPREHLHFAFWYLKEHGLVSRSDNNRFQATVKGVDYVESNRAELPVAQERLLPAPAQTA